MSTKSVTAFAKGNERTRKILDKHFDGICPSRIDAALNLVRGESRATICDYWRFVKLNGNKLAD